MDLHFSQHFGVSAGDLAEYGAFDISVVSDLPLFIDPFLLFNSEREDYQELHESIIRYLVYLRDKAAEEFDEGMINSLYRFKEVKQNWLGFTMVGNSGSGLGKKFAESLHGSLRTLMSDFTTNLIKGYLCEYTSTFARDHLSDERCSEFAVPRARFNYETETWATRNYLLPALGRDLVLLRSTNTSGSDSAESHRRRSDDQQQLRRSNGSPR